MGGNVTVPTGQVRGRGLRPHTGVPDRCPNGVRRGLLVVQLATARQQLLRSRRYQHRRTLRSCADLGRRSPDSLHESGRADRRVWTTESLFPDHTISRVTVQPSIWRHLAGARSAPPWVSFPNLYHAQCQSSGGATWLQITDVAGPKDTRPTVQPVLGPRWGLHLDDVNLALGNLVQVVRDESLAYVQ